MRYEDLQKCRARRHRIIELNGRIKMIRSALESATQVLSDMPRGSDGKDKMAERVSRLIELEKRRTDEVLEYEVLARQLEESLTKLTPQQEHIMILRYIEGRSWGEIIKKTHYSKSSVFYQHRQAIRKITEKEK